MKIRINGTVRAFLLVEALVYLSLVFVIAGGASMVAYHMMERSARLKQKTDLMTRALQIGELWRKEVRHATGPIRLVNEGDRREFHIPNDSGEIVYVYEKNQLLRLANTNATAVLLLPKVPSSRMIKDSRGGVVSWRWEIQLPSHREVARVKPNFTFQAVPGFEP